MSEVVLAVSGPWWGFDGSRDDDGGGGDDVGVFRRFSEDSFMILFCVTPVLYQIST